MGSLGQVLIQYEWPLSEEIRTQTYTVGRPREDREKMAIYYPWRDVTEEINPWTSSLGLVASRLDLACTSGL